MGDYLVLDEKGNNLGVIKIDDPYKIKDHISRAKYFIELSDINLAHYLR